MATRSPLAAIMLARMRAGLAVPAPVVDQVARDTAAQAATAAINAQNAAAAGSANADTLKAHADQLVTLAQQVAQIQAAQAAAPTAPIPPQMPAPSDQALMPAPVTIPPVDQFQYLPPPSPAASEMPPASYEIVPQDSVDLSPAPMTNPAYTIAPSDEFQAGMSGLGADTAPAAAAPAEQSPWVNIASALVGAWQTKKLTDINMTRAQQGLPPISAGDAGVGAQVTVGIDPGLKKLLMIGGVGISGLLIYLLFRRTKRGA